MTSQFKLLLKMRDLLKENNIDYWLSYGTLLGAIRDKIFMPHDDKDIDIGINQKDYWKVRQLLEKQSVLKYKRIWRTEIALYEDDKAHIDLFFYTEKGKYMLSSAFLRNKLQGGINIESGMKLLKDNIYPLKTITFLRKKFTVPRNPEAILTEKYGDWKTEDTVWCHAKSKSLDIEHRTIAIIIPTFLRDNKLMKSIDSILKHCEEDDMFRQWVRIYVGDQGYDDWSEEKIKFYDKLKEAGHKVFNLPFDCGLSYARNYLVKQSSEPYVMIVDDDFKFNKNTNLGTFIEILNHKKENGIVGGDIENRPKYHANFIFERKSDELYLNRIQQVNKVQKVTVHSTTCDYKNNTEIEYCYADIVLNFFLAKREVLEDVPLDNNLKLVEHTDHFLRIKKETNWKVCHCSKVTCEHLDGKNNDEYRNFRNNPKYTKMFLDKWNLNSARNIIKIVEEDISDVNYNEIESQEDVSDIDVGRKIKIVQIARIPCANSGYELSNLINTYSTKYESRYILGGKYLKNMRDIPFREFPYDLLWGENKEECIKIIQDADIIHIHHDSWPEIEQYFKNKKVVSTLYNLTNSLQYNNNAFNNNYINKLKSFGMCTVADQPLQKKMFNDVSNINVPLVKMLFNHDFKQVDTGPITIGFSPTNHENIGIGSKRYSDVLSCIADLQASYTFNFKLIEGLPYEENLKEKSFCDILIDDVDDRYEKGHNTTIEAGLLNAVPLTNYSGDWFPSLKTNILNLKETLIRFLENESLIDDYRNTVLENWRKNVYTPKNLLNIYEELYKSLFVKNITIKTAKTFIEKDIDSSETKKEIQALHFLLVQKDISYCLLKTSCLDSIKYGKLKTEPNDLFIAVSDITKASDAIDCLNLKLNVHVEKNYPSKTKKMGFYGIAVNVPFPVVSYLNNTIGQGWEKKDE